MKKRSGRPARFAAVPNDTIDNAVAMDLEALGLLAVLIRHQDGWDIQLATIARKYGYGRDGLAGAMGLLQVARYVVKIRIMAWKGNAWSTEVVVYDTPATDAEVSALLDSVEREPDVRQVQLIEPTPKALAAAAKRRAKLSAGKPAGKLNITVPRHPVSRESGLTCDNDSIDQVVPDSRDSRVSGNAGVTKKTVSQKTTEDDQAPAARAAGDARRAGAGSNARAGAGGSAASCGAGAPTPGARSAKGTRTGRTRMSAAQAAAVAAVEAAWPEALAPLLPKYRPAVLRDTILAALDGGRTAEQLADRVRRRWWNHGYAIDAAHGGKGIGSAVGVAVGLVRPSTDCPDPMCEDGARIHVGQQDVCPKCEERRAQRRASRRQGLVPGPRAAAPAAVWWECEGTDDRGLPCEATGKGTRPEDGLCWKCHGRAEAEVIERAVAGLRAEMATEYAAQAERLRAAVRWGAMPADAYAEHAEREAARDAELRARQAAEVEDTRRLRRQLAANHPELAAYAQQTEPPAAAAPL
ncbi:hypothetical protein ACIQU4_39220 [Streptomyces sp. NPDC090741]|uniref:hypothetical protein n=1 Tax=Streptomyces sp. NPDC090741 TaxID=3365967 RepID=UPI0037FC865B